MNIHEKQHKESLERVKAKWGHIKDCLLLIKWHREYTGQTLSPAQTKKLFAFAKKWALRKKYDRLDYKMFDLFENKDLSFVTDHNRKVVERYGFMFHWRKR